MLVEYYRQRNRQKPNAGFARGVLLTGGFGSSGTNLLFKKGYYGITPYPSESHSWPQLIVPQSMQQVNLKELHEGEGGNHLSKYKTLNKFKERYYLLGYLNAVQDWCQTCPECTTRKSQAPTQRAPLNTITAGNLTQVMARSTLFAESNSENLYVMVVNIR